MLFSCALTRPRHLLFFRTVSREFLVDCSLPSVFSTLVGRPILIWDGHPFFELDIPTWVYLYGLDVQYNRSSVVHLRVVVVMSAATTYGFMANKCSVTYHFSPQMLLK
jgi:hypothetical protein